MDEVPEFAITGAGKYRFITMTIGKREITERLPLHFFKLDQERKEAMVRDICKTLKRKMAIRSVR